MKNQKMLTSSLSFHLSWKLQITVSLGVSRNPETSKIKFFVSLVKGFQSLINVTKNSNLDAAGDLDPPL